MTAIGSDAPRVVIDTNAALDWLVFRAPAALALGHVIEQRRWIWCATLAMLDELRWVLSRPLDPRWDRVQKFALTIDLAGLATLCQTPAVQAQRDAMVCRDPADQMFIDLALGHRPCWLVTRDKALLALRRRAAARGVAIATPELWRCVHAAVQPPTPGDAG